MDFEKIKLGSACGALGAFALFGIGFGMLGWVLGGTAQERAAIAVVERLTPICFAQFKQDPAKDAKAKTLQKMDYGKQAAFVATQGWATMPGEKKPDGTVAEKCGDLITG